MAQISCHVLDGSWDDSKSSKTQVGKSVIGGILNLAEMPDSSVVDSCNIVVLNILRLFAFKPGQFRGHCTLVACAGNKYLCVAVWIMIKNKCPLRRGPFLASSTMFRIIYSALLFVKHFCIWYLVFVFVFVFVFVYVFVFLYVYVFVFLLTSCTMSRIIYSDVLFVRPN